MVDVLVEFSNEQEGRYRDKHKFCFAFADVFLVLEDINILHASVVEISYHKQFNEEADKHDWDQRISPVFIYLILSELWQFQPDVSQHYVEQEKENEKNLNLADELSDSIA
jgi:hypothetical protein